MSHAILEDIARLKVRYPDRVHFLLGNHELAELTDYPIQKNKQMLNVLFRMGLEQMYGAGNRARPRGASGVPQNESAGRADCRRRVRLPQHSGGARRSARSIRPFFPGRLIRWSSTSGETFSTWYGGAIIVRRTPGPLPN